MRTSIWLITLICFLTLPMLATANILTDKLLGGVEDVLHEKFEKIEEEIDEFIMAEIKKVEKKTFLLRMPYLYLSLYLSI